MGVQIQTALIVAVILCAQIINLASADRRLEHRAAFIWLLSSFVLYNAALFYFGVSGEGRHFMLLSGLLAAWAIQNFFAHYLHHSSLRLLSGLVLVSLSTLLLLPTSVAEGPALPIFVAMTTLGTYSFSIWQLYRKALQSPSKTAKQRLMYLVVGGVLSIVLLGVDLLSLQGFSLPCIGQLFNALYLFVWLQAIQSERLLDLKEFLVRMLCLCILVLCLSLIMAGLVIWARDSLGWFVYNLLLAGLVIAVVFQPIQQFIEKTIGPILFRERFELGLHMEQLQRNLTHTLDLNDMGHRVLGFLEESHRFTHASLFLLDLSGQYTAHHIMGPIEQNPLNQLQGREFLDLLRKERVVKFNVIERECEHLNHQTLSGELLTQKTHLIQIRETMKLLSAQVTIGLLDGDRLLGFLNLKDDRPGGFISRNELNLFLELCAQLTAIVRNSEIQRQLNEQKRLSMIGEMATGMAHEIRNPLGAIKAAAELIASSPDETSPVESEEGNDERKEMIEVIIEESDRLNLVLNQFLDYARPFRGSFEATDLNQIADRVAKMTQTSRGVHVELCLQKNLPLVMADGSQIRQVCLNLAQNACDALSERYGDDLENAPDAKLTITTSLTTAVDANANETQRARLTLSDNGNGIPDEVQKNLFVPFFTTKRKGTGLGLAVSQKLLQQHQSALRLTSEPGKGTSFFFTLPLYEDEVRITQPEKAIAQEK